MRATPAAAEPRGRPPHRDGTMARRPQHRLATSNSSIDHTEYDANPASISSRPKMHPDIYHEQSIRALFKRPLAHIGTIPACSISLCVYGNGKRLIAEHPNHGHKNSYPYLSAAAIVCIATGTVMNPIWVVKMRGQLAHGQGNALGGSWVHIK